MLRTARAAARTPEAFLIQSFAGIAGAGSPRRGKNAEGVLDLGMYREHRQIVKNPLFYA